MNWLVDGYNVSRRDPELRGREQESLEAGRAALLRVLATAARLTGDEFTVVFDGARREATAGSGGRVHVVFSRPPDSADDVLRRMAGAGTVVVSSDRAVSSAATRAGAVAVTAEDFVAALQTSDVAADEDDAAEEPDRKRGNPRRASREARSSRRALARLSSRLTGRGPIG
ncbi:MAG TPA: NYN domain-containing protein [Methylomirabilota bacterium]|nr:NYN domain-containing protein [Methylomirabilota bacterium]